MVSFDLGGGHEDVPIRLPVLAVEDEGVIVIQVPKFSVLFQKVLLDLGDLRVPHASAQCPFVLQLGLVQDSVEHLAVVIDVLRLIGIPRVALFSIRERELDADGLVFWD